MSIRLISLRTVQAAFVCIGHVMSIIHSRYHFLMFVLHFFIYLKSIAMKAHRDLLFAGLLIECTQQAGLGLAKAGSQELHPSRLRGLHGSKYLNRHLMPPRCRSGGWLGRHKVARTPTWYCSLGCQCPKPQPCPLCRDT